MKKDRFFTTALTTVTIIRSSIFLSRFFIPETHIIYNGYTIHHFWLGFPLIIAGLLVPRKYDHARQYSFGIGAGPIADEIIFMITGPGGYSVYWALPSVLGMLFCMTLLFMFRKRISKYLS